MIKALYILIAIIMLGFIVTAHEFGHYLVGRLCGIGIVEFSVGFGPKLFGWSRKGILYSLRAIPLGGYCSFVGEDGVSDNPAAMNNQPVWKRFLTVLSGPLMNFIIAFVFCVVLLCGFFTAEYLPKISVVQDGSPAAACGLEPGDVLTRVGDVEISYDQAGVQAVSAAVQSADLSAPLELTALRNGEAVRFSLVPAKVTGDDGTESYIIGISLTGRRYRLLEAIGSGCSFMTEITGEMLQALKDLVFHGEGVNDMMGPVGIISFVSDQVYSEKLYAVVYLIFILSLNIGIMNLLPLPALDGGRLVFLIVEAIRGKPIPPEKEGLIHAIGFGLLLVLILMITYKDILGLFRGR